MDQSIYLQLARQLDALPNGFPYTDDGAELRRLAKLFTPEESELAAQLRIMRETPITRLNGSPEGQPSEK